MIDVKGMDAWYLVKYPILHIVQQERRISNILRIIFIIIIPSAYAKQAIKSFQISKIPMAYQSNDF